MYGSWISNVPQRERSGDAAHVSRTPSSGSPTKRRGRWRRARPPGRPRAGSGRRDRPARGSAGISRDPFRAQRRARLFVPSSTVTGRSVESRSVKQGRRAPTSPPARRPSRSGRTAPPPRGRGSRDSRAEARGRRPLDRVARGPRQRAARVRGWTGKRSGMRRCERDERLDRRRERARVVDERRPVQRHEPVLPARGRTASHGCARAGSSRCARSESTIVLPTRWTPRRRSPRAARLSTASASGRAGRRSRDR